MDAAAAADNEGHRLQDEGGYDPKVANEFARRMLDKGVYVVGFCYPVVPKGRDRVRTQISAGHTKEDLDFAVKCFGEVKKEMGL